MTVSPNPKPLQPDSTAFAQGVTVAAKERAQRHLQRAQELIKLKNYKEAVQELRDAVQADPHQSEYHAWLGKIHLDQGMTGMAAVSLRQALKLNPDDALALECVRRLNPPTPAQIKQPEGNRGGLFGGLFGKQGRK